MYEKAIKRFIGLLVSALGIIVLAFPMIIIGIIIKIDSPGPVFFKQKRVGRNKEFFTILKFRTMPTSVSPDVPTHQFKDKMVLSSWQHFMRKSSLDELPQLFCIFIGKMAVIGPRPALWNQDDLVAERDKYNANSCRPGLTGWAQINGRDELEIPVKAKLDGEYAQILHRGGFRAFGFDLRCFFSTFFSVFRGDGVVEGGTGEININKH